MNRSNGGERREAGSSTRPSPGIRRWVLVACALPVALATLGLPARASDTSLRAASRFFEGLDWSVEARIRYDAVFGETTTGTSDRYRGRFSLRGGFTKRLNERVLFGFRMSTGSAASPTSSYQSFDNISVGKPFALDHVYANVQPFESAPAGSSFAAEAMRSLHLVLGKQPTPFRSTQLTWDRDVSVEGISEALQVSRGAWTARAVAGQYAMDDNAGPDDPYVLSQGLELDYAPDTRTSLLVTAGLHHFIRPFSLDATSQSWTNFKAADHVLPAGFNVLDLSTAYTFTPGTRPVRLTFGYIRNLGAQAVTALGSTEDQGYQVDACYGKASTPGTWEVGINHRRVEADATPGQFGEGEPATMNGGGTDVEGTSLRFAYACWKDVTWSASGYRSRAASSRALDRRMRLETTLLVKF